MKQSQNSRTLNFLIEGRVQGVGYRAFARRAAEQLGLGGWARNLSDGRVEVLASGSAEVLQAYEIELKKGPAHGKVTTVAKTEIAFINFSEFSIREDA